MRINEDLEEKPDHLHYPACLGRMNEIRKQSFEIFVYTAIVFFVFGIFSIVGIKFNMFAVIPDLLFDEDGTKIAFFQIFEFIIVTVISLLGCTKYKIFDVIIMLMYVLMVILSIFSKYNSADPVVFLAGAGGLWKSIGSLRIWNDYEQLSQTEGFPIFSLILTEQEKKMQESMLQNTVDNTLTQLDPASSLGQAVAMTAANQFNMQNNTGMPTINTVPVTDNRMPDRRYLPNSQKESCILECPMKFIL